eukprot:SAG11_NODE_3235_length_2592_cov_6.052146_2_plen_62_part_00
MSFFFNKKSSSHRHTHWLLNLNLVLVYIPGYRGTRYVCDFFFFLKKIVHTGTLNTKFNNII